MEPQAASAVLLVRPAAFGFNAEAAQSNVFAHASSDGDVQRRALVEFDGLARRLADAGVEVLILEDTPEPARPDAVFPNNWFTTHADGTMVIYPMASALRRLERRVSDVRSLLEQAGFQVSRIIDFSDSEKHGRFVEGTGSLVLDRPRRHAYASLSVRTDADLVAEFDRRLDYSTFVFEARDPGGRPIYHTNVLMSLGTRFAVLCPEAVAPEHREAVAAQIEETGRTIVEMSFAQLRRFGCNVIELSSSSSGDPVIPLSATAIKSLRLEQLRALESFGDLVEVPIPTIEAVGGGSVRCMIADINLPRR